MQSTNGAAHAELTPLRFLERASTVFPDRVAIVDGPRRITYREFACEATRLANGLVASGIEPGARVAYLCPNTAPLLIAHFAVPLADAVLVAINTRLTSEETTSAITPARDCSSSTTVCFRPSMRSRSRLPLSRRWW